MSASSVPDSWDCRQIGWGASGRNNGLVVPGLKRDPHEVRRLLGTEAGDRLLEFSGEAPGRLFQLIEQHGIQCEAVNKGWMQAAHSRFALAAIERRVSDWRALGADVTMIRESRLEARLGTDYYRGASLDPRGGSLNPLAFVRGLADAARRAGARIFAGTPMLESYRSDGRWIVETPHGMLNCQNLLLCANAYGNSIDALRATVIPLRTAQVASTPLDEKSARKILPRGEAASDTQRLLTSFRITADRRLIMGGAGATAGDENQNLLRRLYRAAADRFPYLGSIRWEYGWSGYLAITRHHLPMVLRVDDGLYGGVGCNGRGIAMATMMGGLLADLVSGSADSECPVPVRAPRRMTGFPLRHPGVAMAVMAKCTLDRVSRRISSV
jgi:glycine/D-amino acid oxidase-like deaminating enzyme